MNRGSPALRVIVGVALGAAALWLTFRDIPLVTLRNTLSTADPALTLASLAGTLVSLGLVVVRWRTLFRPDHPHVPLATLFRATVVGQMLNIVSPIRVGEVARLYRVTDETGLEAGRVFATLAVEKVLEVSVFGIAAITLAAVVVPADGVAWNGARRVGLALVAFLLLAAGAHAAGWVQRLPVIGRLPGAVANWVSAQAAGFTRGLSAMRSAKVGAQAAAFSVAALLASAWSNQVLLSAFGLNLPMWTGLLLLVVLQVGSVPPSLPGRLGVFNYLTMLTLTSLGADRTVAASYSLALYAVAYLPKVLLGASFLAVRTRLPQVMSSPERIR